MAAAAVTTAPATAPFPMSVPGQLRDPKVESLKAMFPDLESDILEAFLASNNGDVEMTVSQILDVNVDAGATQAALDESVARALQAEMDGEVARAVHADIQQELSAQRQQEQPAVRASAAMEKAATATKSLFARATRSLSARARGPSHATRLLEVPSERADNDVTLDWTPLAVPAYTPPTAPAQPAAVADPVPAQPATVATVLTEVASPPTSDRYSARLSRARTANQLSQRSTGTRPVDAPMATLAPLTAPMATLAPLTALPSPPVAPTAAPVNAVPIGDLI